VQNFPYMVHVRFNTITVCRPTIFNVRTFRQIVKLQIGLPDEEKSTRPSLRPLQPPADGQSEVAETTVQWEEWGLSDDDASESEYAEGEVD